MTLQPTLCVVLDHSAHLGLPRALQNCLQLRQVAADAAWALAVVTRQLMSCIAAATLFFEVPQQRLAATAGVLQTATLELAYDMWVLNWACMSLQMQSIPQLTSDAGCIGISQKKGSPAAAGCAICCLFSDSTISAYNASRMSFR